MSFNNGNDILFGLPPFSFYVQALSCAVVDNNANCQLLGSGDRYSGYGRSKEFLPRKKRQENKKRKTKEDNAA